MALARSQAAGWKQLKHILATEIYLLLLSPGDVSSFAPVIGCM